MRRCLLLLGLVGLAGIWLGPLPEQAQYSFVAHMVLHIGLVAVLAPLIAVGLAGSRVDPVCTAPRLFTPIPAALAEMVIVWGWHAPLVHQFTRLTPWLLVLEQLSFLAVGLWVWLAAFGGDLSQRAARAGGGIIGLLLTSMHMTLLGALLTLAPRPLYFQCSVSDQQLGGVIMLIGGGIAYLLGGLWLLRDMLRESTDTQCIPPTREETW